MGLLKEIEPFAGHCSWASLEIQEVRSLPGKRCLATVSLCTAYKTVSSPSVYLEKAEKQKGFVVFSHLPVQSREFVSIWMSNVWDRSVVCLKQSNYWLKHFAPTIKSQSVLISSFFSDHNCVANFIGVSPCLLWHAANQISCLGKRLEFCQFCFISLRQNNVQSPLGCIILVKIQPNLLVMCGLAVPLQFAHCSCHHT